MRDIKRRQRYTGGEINYKEYKLNIKECFFCIVGIVTILGIISYTFYKSLIIFVIMCIPMPFYIKKIKIFLCKIRLHRLILQFKDFCQSLAAQLSAGYSLENGLIEVYRELEQIYGCNSYICKEVKYMIAKIKINVNIESAFKNFAERCMIEDISLFSEVLSIAKRSGGDIIGIVKNASDSIGRKIEVEREIKMIINSKKFEQIIMDVVPILIILFVQITSPGMMDVMYETLLGRIIMTICLVIYVFAVMLGYKLSNIEM